MLILDTDILIDIQRGHEPARQWFASLESVPALSGFAVMELVQGARNSQEVRQALLLVAPMPVVWPTETDCNRALSDFATYHHSYGLGLLDALIAATAVGAGATLCTFNARHFQIVPGLETQQPFELFVKLADS